MRGIALLTPEDGERGDQRPERLEERLEDDDVEAYDIPEWGDVSHLLREEDR